MTFFQSNASRYALRLMIGCFLVTVLCESLHLKNGYWAVFSVVTCIWPTQGISLQRAKQRTLGTFIGMWLGILIAHSFSNNLVLIDGLLVFFVFAAIYLKAYNYGYYITFTTVVTVLLVCLVFPGDWQVAIMRFVMTLMGAFIALLVSLTIFPSRVSESISAHFERLKTRLQQYYQHICEAAIEPHPSAELYQQQSATALQQALSQVKEASNEFGFKHRPQKIAEYQRLENIYEMLLLLEIQTPIHAIHPDLKILKAKLDNVLTAAIPFFLKADAPKISTLRAELADLQQHLRLQHIKAAADLSIQSTTFFAHLELGLFMEAFQKLLAVLQEKSAN